jgi:hypothetical protein
MMTDIVMRARVRAKMVEGHRAHGDEIGLTSSLLRELADEIERLRARYIGLENLAQTQGVEDGNEIERLRDALAELRQTKALRRGKVESDGCNV